MNEFFPLEKMQHRTIPLEPLRDDTCSCGHDGVQHMSLGQRCCMVAQCKCYSYKRFDISKVKDTMDKAMVYFHEQESYDDRVRWVFKNIKFFRNIADNLLYLYWWKHILQYDPFTEFMDKDTLIKITHYGNPATIERSGRRVREECKKNLHDTRDGCQYCPFDPDLIEAKLEKEFGIYSYYSENKIK